ncbi:hypothetical protein CN397_24170 [Priestia megaterium]|nr:hypothetical protein CN397_24170 [Priestia megaterium]
MSPITEGNYKRYVTDGDKGVWLLYHRWKRRCLGALFSGGPQSTNLNKRKRANVTSDIITSLSLEMLNGDYLS